jgi:hypothetical protein
VIIPLMGSTVSGRPAGVAVREGFTDAKIAKSMTPIQVAMINEIFMAGFPGIGILMQLNNIFRDGASGKSHK